MSAIIEELLNRDLDSDPTIITDEDAENICEFLDIPYISRDESFVCVKAKFWNGSRSIEIVITFEEVEASEIVYGPEEIDLDSWHAGYKITVSVATDYDQDDGFDKYYPVF